MTEQVVRQMVGKGFDRLEPDEKAIILWSYGIAVEEGQLPPLERRKECLQRAKSRARQLERTRGNGSHT